MLKELKGLKDEMGISLLVLANTLKRSAWRPLFAGDVQGSRAIANYADNIFAIGRCRADANLRYIKHVRPRSSELVYGTDHVPSFRIAKRNENFLSFEFRGFASEAELVRNTGDTQDWRTIEKVKSLSDEGMSLRQIAAELNISKSTAHRYLHMPLAEENDFPEEMDEEEDEMDEIDVEDPYYFPGREEFDCRR